MKQGTNPNARDKECRTPLHLVPSTRLDIARILLAYVVDVNVEDGAAKAPLQVALTNGETEAVQFLSEYRSNWAHMHSYIYIFTTRTVV